MRLSAKTKRPKTDTKRPVLDTLTKRLEIRCTGNGTVGSNPTRSAKKSTLRRAFFNESELPHELTLLMNYFAESVSTKESGNELLEWGGKLFYFDCRKCIRFTNFASNYTLFLFDIKMSEVQNVGNLIANSI